MTHIGNLDINIQRLNQRNNKKIIRHIYCLIFLFAEYAIYIFNTVKLLIKK